MAEYDDADHYNVKQGIHLSGDGAMKVTKEKAADTRQSIIHKRLRRALVFS
jgi:hypothetical protein